MRMKNFNQIERLEAFGTISLKVDNYMYIDQFQVDIFPFHENM